MEEPVDRSQSVGLDLAFDISAQGRGRRLENTRSARIAVWRLHRAIENRERQQGKLGLAVDRLNETLVEQWQRQVAALPRH
jgi:hypothetical protein